MCRCLHISILKYICKLELNSSLRHKVLISMLFFLNMNLYLHLYGYIIVIRIKKSLIISIFIKYLKTSFLYPIAHVTGCHRFIIRSVNNSHKSIIINVIIKQSEKSLYLFMPPDATNLQFY